MGRKSVHAPGFTAVEAVLVIVVLIGIVGAGYMVLSRKHQSANVSSTSKPASSQSQTPPLNGTSASVSQLTQLDGQTEAKADSSADAQTQQAGANSDSALTNVGGSYNENNL